MAYFSRSADFISVRFFEDFGTVLTNEPSAKLGTTMEAISSPQAYLIIPANKTSRIISITN